MDETAGELVEKYIRIRDRRADLKREYEAKDGEAKADLEGISKKLLAICKDTEADSIGTSYGTVIRQVRSRYWVNDWAGMKEFVISNDALDILEKRIHQTNMKQWLDENPDKLPPGLNYDSWYDIVVRRK